MTIISDILNILEKETLTSSKIAERLQLRKTNLYPKLSRLKQENRIETINGKIPHEYRAITNKALLSKLHSIMMDKMEPSGNLTDDDIYFIQLIEERLEDD